MHTFFWLYLTINALDFRLILLDRNIYNMKHYLYHTFFNTDRSVFFDTAVRILRSSNAIQTLCDARVCVHPKIKHISSLIGLTMFNEVTSLFLQQNWPFLLSQFFFFFYIFTKKTLIVKTEYAVQAMKIPKSVG